MLRSPAWKTLSALTLFAVAAPALATQNPIPVSTRIRVHSSEARVGLWENLSTQEKNLAYHLIKAAEYGRDLLLNQTHRHGLAVRDFLAHTLSEQNIENTRTYFGSTEEGQASFNELVAYAAKFKDQFGPYAPSNLKYVLNKVSPAQIEELLQRYIASTGATLSAETVTEIARLLADPTFEVTRQPEDESGSNLDTTGGNLYDRGITGAEVLAALQSGELKSDLNCRIRRLQSSPGGLYCEKQTTQTPGIVGATLRKVVAELAEALPYATTEHQRGQIEDTIRYFIHGDIQDFRSANIHWIQDRTNSKVDFMMGFVESYTDYHGKIGAWESYVQIVDPETTQLSAQLAHFAQYFEDQMPYGQWKKTFPADYAPPALMAYYFQEIADMRSGGYNLPNFDDIRRDYGFKNVIRLPLPGDDQIASSRLALEESIREFTPAEKVEETIEHDAKSYRVLVLLHEIIGHGSGTYDTSKYGPTEDPIGALARIGGAALEEQRADLTALVFGDDQKLIDVGVYKDAEDARKGLERLYDSYVGIRFHRYLAKNRTLSEAHMRGNWLLINQLLKAGAIAWEARVIGEERTLQNQVLRVKDYGLFRTVARNLLAELQRIKAERDENALRNLMATDAPLDAIRSDWAQAIISRGANLLVNAGTVEQPWTVRKIDSSTFLLSPQGGETLESIAPYLF